MRTNEQGRSMIEMLGVLAIVGVLSVGGIAGYSKAMNKFKTNKVVDQVNMLATNIRTLYSSQRSYKNLSNENARLAGVVPGEMFDPTGDDKTIITNGFGGDTTVLPLDYMAQGDNQAFMIAIEKVPQAACVSIATTDWGGDSGSGLIAMYVGAQEDTDTGVGGLEAYGASLTGDNSGGLAVNGGSDDAGLPYSVVKAAQNCDESESVIAWKYI